MSTHMMLEDTRIARARELLKGPLRPDRTPERTLGRTPDRTLVKLCGLHRPEDVIAANEAAPDLVGFVIDFPRSHRNVPVTQLLPLATRIDSAIIRVGVFVDEDPGLVAALVADNAIDVCQLHGREDEYYISRLHAELDVAGVPDAPILQAFRVRTQADVLRAESSCADAILLDNGQGTGKRFDWSLVAHARRPFVLAGGLNPDNVAEAISATRPLAVDMSSGVETDGKKDADKMKAAVAAVRSAR